MSPALPATTNSASGGAGGTVGAAGVSGSLVAGVEHPWRLGGARPQVVDRAVVEGEGIGDVAAARREQGDDPGAEVDAVQLAPRPVLVQQQQRRAVGVPRAVVSPDSCGSISCWRPVTASQISGSVRPWRSCSTSSSLESGSGEKATGQTPNPCPSHRSPTVVTSARSSAEHTDGRLLGVTVLAVRDRHQRFVARHRPDRGELGMAVDQPGLVTLAAARQLDGEQLGAGGVGAPDDGVARRRAPTRRESPGRPTPTPRPPARPRRAAPSTLRARRRCRRRTTTRGRRPARCRRPRCRPPAR